MTIPDAPAATGGVAHLDVLDPAFRPDGPEVAAARDACWWATTPLGVAVLRREQVCALLADRRFQVGAQRILSSQGLTEGPVVEWMDSILLSIEGDDHTRLRRLVNRAFTPRAVERLRPLMRQVADELVDGLPADGRVEFMAAFADPYPARIICELLGVPPEWRERFRGWASDLGLVFNTATVAADIGRIEAALAGLHAATDELIAARRAAPGPDLLSALIAAEAEGDRLTPAELRTTVGGLLFAGHDTTRNQLGQAMALFLAHPGQWELLRRRPELAPQAVEEVLRLAPAVPTVSRVAVEDVEVDGVTFPAGTWVAMMTAAAGRDPAAFGPDAGAFDITVPRPAPLTFGAGVHHCLGANLARAELAEALAVLARRLGPIEPAGDAVWRPAMGIAGPITLPLRCVGEPTGSRGPHGGARTRNTASP